MYDPEKYDGVGAMPTLYTKTANGAVNQWTVWAAGNRVYTEWGQVQGALQTSFFECEPKNEGRANSTTAEEQAVKEAISHWKKKRKKKYFLTAEEAEGTRNLKPMLAKDFKRQKRAPAFPAWVQRKLDGLRCLAYVKNGKVTLQSRGGDSYAVHHIQEELRLALPPGYILDGELYHHGTSLQTINSWVRRPQKASSNVQYHVYDVVEEENPQMKWEDRMQTLNHFFNSSFFHFRDLKSVFLMDTYYAHQHSDMEKLHDSFVREGYEGAIYRSSSGVYRFGYRSSDLLKYKSFEEDEFPIVGWKKGRGKFSNVPIFECRCGQRSFDVAPQGSMEERLEMLNNADDLIGKMLTVRYFNMTPDGIPFHPVGVAIREPGS